MKNSFMLGKGRFLLVLFVALTFCGISVYADSIEEDFENVSIVDADGQPLTSAWASGTGLSNGWRIVNGTIYDNDNGDYGLIHSAGMGFELSDYYLSSSSTSKNDAYVFIPSCLQGEVTLWARSNLTEKSKKTSALKIYEATADGSVETDVLLFSATPTKGKSSWTSYSFTIEGEGKYIAINLVYTDIDSFSATISDGSLIEPELTVSATSLDFGTLSAESTLSFTVKSNVTTSVSFDITGSDRDAFEVVNAPATLAAGVEKKINVKMNAPEPGDYKATLKVSARELTSKITLMGTWKEKSTEPGQEETAEWKGEDFTGLTDIPAGWTVAEGANWGIDDWWVDLQTSLKGFSGFICTPMFTVTAGQAIAFYFEKSVLYDWSSKCTIYYSTDKKNWVEAAVYDRYTDNGVKEIALPAAGSYSLGLEVNTNTYFDNFKIVGEEQPTTIDITAIIAAIASGQATNAYDVNKDGKTDIGDIITIINGNNK